MINCQNCNTQVPEGTKFCTNCGSPINQPMPENNQYNQSGDTNNYQQGGYMPTQQQPVQNNQNNGYVPNAQPAQNTQNSGYIPNSQPEQYGNIPNGQGQQGYYGQPQYPVNNGYPKEDKANAGLCVLSVLIPIFGVIYFFCVRKDKPKEAKACLKSGLISAGCILVFTFVMVAVIIGGVFGIVNKVVDETDDIDWNYSEDYDDDYDYDYDFDWDYEDDDIEDDENVSSDNVDSESSSSQAVVSSADWKDYTVTINGKNYSLPISYSDFSSATGFTFKSTDDADSTLKNKYYNIVTLTNGDKKIHVSILNDTGSMITQKEGKIIGFSNYRGEGEDVVKYAGGLYAGQEITKDEIIAILGEPDDVYEGDDDYWSLKWYEDYDSYYGANKFTITVYGGIITDIDMDRQIY